MRPLDADEIEGDALAHIEAADLDPKEERAATAILVARKLINVHARVRDGLKAPRYRRETHGGVVHHILETPPPRVLADAHEAIGHEFGEGRVPDVGYVGTRRFYSTSARTEIESTHYGDALAMPAPAFRSVWARADYDLAWVAEVFGVSETAVVRRYGELLGPVVLVVRGRVDRWRCEDWEWLTGPIVTSAALGAYRWATPVVLTDRLGATAVFLHNCD